MEEIFLAFEKKFFVAKVEANRKTGVLHCEKEKLDCARKNAAVITHSVGGGAPLQWEEKFPKGKFASRLKSVAISGLLCIYLHCFDAPLTCQSWQRKITSHCSYWKRKPRRPGSSRNEPPTDEKERRAMRRATAKPKLPPGKV